MNEIFNFHGKQVRTLIIDDEPWFVGKDVAEVLGYSNSRDALSKHVNPLDKLTSQIATAGQRRNMTVINESGLFSLIIKSELPQLEEFQRWVTSEVLPAIRKTGGYINSNLSDDAFIALFTGQKQLRQKQDEMIADIDYLKNEQPIHPSFAQVLLQKRKARVMTWLGGKESQAYADTLFAKSVFREAEKDFKEHFSISRYDMLPKKFEEQALAYWRNWEPSTNTKMKIRELNTYQEVEYG